MYSLIETAKANGLKSFFVISCGFEKLPLAQTESDLKNLLPQHVDPAALGAPIQ